MDRRSFLKAASLGILAPLALTGKGLSATVGRRPNILFVFTDDQPPHTVPAMEKTLARFAGEGVPGANFTENAYTAVPLCGPARCAVLTGRYQHSNGVTGNDGAFLQYRKRGYPKTDMLSRVKAAGYRLGFFGKYINGYEFNNRYVHPAFTRGHKWVGLADGQGQKNYMVNVNGTLREETEEHSPYFGKQAIQFIEDSKGTGPWFAYLNWTDPHLPYKAEYITGSYSNPATRETDLSDKSDYTRSRPTPDPDHHRRVHQGQGGEVERLDSWMERLFAVLGKTGQLENTVVLYSSDNGFLTGEHGGLTKKAMPYTEAAGTPLLVRGPGFGPHPGGSPLVSHVDLTATVCAIADADTTGLEGRDLRGLWRGEPWRERLLVEQISQDGERWAMVREGPHAYVDFKGEVRDKELYDLSADPHQLESLHASPEHADLMAYLDTKLDAMRSATGSAIGTAENA